MIPVIFVEKLGIEQLYTHYEPWRILYRSVSLNTSWTHALNMHMEAQGAVILY